MESDEGVETEGAFESRIKSIEAKYAKGRDDMLRQFADTETVVRMVQPMHERGEKE